jgi:hypothetical protein
MNILKELQAKYNKQLLPEQTVAKELGLTKKELKVLLTEDTLPSIEIDGKHYVSIMELANFLGYKESTDYGQQNAELQSYTELECMTSTGIQIIPEKKDGDVMQYTGSISKLKDGRFMVQIEMGKTADGKRNRKSKSFRDEKLAQQYLDNTLAELNGVVTIMPTTPANNQVVSYMQTQPVTFTDKTFEQYAVETLNKGVGRAGSRTIEGYRISLMQVNKYIGNMKMVDISTDILRNTFEKLFYHYMKASLKKSFVTIKMIFNIAFENGDISNDLFIKLKCPKSRKVVDKKISAYSDEEIQIILRESKKYNEVLYPVFAVLECTGMRPGELRALEWSKIDLKAKTVKIIQAITKEYDELTSLSSCTASRECVSVTKTAYSVRTLQLSDLAVNALKDWRAFLDKSP